MGLWEYFTGGKKKKEPFRVKVGTSKHSPKLMTEEQVRAITSLSLNGRIYIGGLFNSYVEVGTTWQTYVGVIVILKVSYSGILFTVVSSEDSTQLGKTYYQTSVGFRDDIKTWPFYAAGKRTKWIVKVAEFEMYLIVGIASSVSGLALVAVISTDVLKFILDNKNNFPKWSKAINTTLLVRTILKKRAPTLYKKTVNFFWRSLWKGVKASAVPVGSNVPESFQQKYSDQNNLARLIGSIVGSIGKKAFESKLSLGGIIAVLGKKVVTQILFDIPGAGKITVKEKKELALQLIEEFRKAGVIISESEAYKIIQEIRRNPKIIKDAFKKMEAAFKHL